MLGVNVAVFREGKILLTKRDDFHVWCLPGGNAETGESLVQAATREVLEETGLEVRITRLVGLYSRPQWEDSQYHIAVFAGEVIAGHMAPQQEEVVDAGFFPEGELPKELLLGQRERILDAFSGAGGSLVRLEHVASPFDQPLTREELYGKRDASGLPRNVFYARHIGRLESDGSTLEVAPGDPPIKESENAT